MIPDILTETLATLRRFDPNGDWYVPDLPDNEASILDWAEYYQDMSDLIEAATELLFVFRVKQAVEQ